MADDTDTRHWGATATRSGTREGMHVTGPTKAAVDLQLFGVLYAADRDTVVYYRVAPPPVHEQQIAGRLAAARALYVTIAGKEPYIGPQLSFSDTGRVQAALYGSDMDDRIFGIGKTASEALDAIDAQLAKTLGRVDVI